ncbi:hypothetical protein PpBr36_02308 [Pyricularia pennisetigena]|uniref:hypothetical protein n=1 Tax=Pyricularia pennisetigena TaxID=1578925 RepID=UPI00114FDF82|nr:hypothetical protein PpBr36_02308 [Pyricularia pennisetigena]TLS30365.1 hypothetical protein PpBr36_02308 [Pyricularia pennisetigena]
MVYTIPNPWQAQNRVPSTNSTKQGKSLIKIFFIINIPAQQCNKNNDFPVENAAKYSPIDNKNPVQIKFTKNGWGPIFGQVNFIHDFKYDRIFNVPNIPPIIPQPGNQLEANILDFRTMGFSHWENNVARLNNDQYLAFHILPRNIIVRTLFDPKINFKVENGIIITIVFGLLNASEGKS